MTTSTPPAPPPTPFGDDRPPGREGPGEPVRVRLHNAGDVVAALPALLGYHADHSIVLLAMRGPRRQIELTMRLDLPSVPGDAASDAPGDVAADAFDDLPGDAGSDVSGGGPAGGPAPTIGDDVWRAVSAVLMRGVSRTQATAVFVVVLDGTEADTRGLMDALEPALRAHGGVDVADVVLVSDGHYRSVHCHDAGCCPVEPRPVPISSAATAALVTQGEVIHGGRDELAARVASPTGQQADVAERAAGLVEATCLHGSVRWDDAGITDLLTQACHGAAGVLTRDLAVRLAVVVQSPECRDMAYRHLLEAGEDSAVTMWESVCRLVPQRLAVVPLVMVALGAYLSGRGALATIAIARACDLDCEHASVRLVDDLMRAAIAPCDVRDALARSLPPAG